MNSQLSALWIDLGACLVASLGHFLWQAVAVGVVVWLAALMLPRQRRNARYRLYLAALLVLMACPIVTFTALVIAHPPATSPPALPQQLTIAAPAAMQTPNPVAEPNPAISQEVRIAEPRTAAVDVTGASPPATWRRFIGPILVTYLVGVALMLLRTIVGLQNATILRRQAEPITAPGILAVLHERAAALGVAAVPPLAASARVIAPCVVGVLRPMILLPVAILNELPPDQLGIILAHELAHLRRQDHWISLLQRLTEVALFFHPVVWIISRKLSAEREMCCDDLVVGNTGQSGRIAYAQLLVRVAELCMPRRRTTAGLAAVGRASELRRRVARLLVETSLGSEFIPQKRMLNAMLIPLIASAIAAWTLLAAGTKQAPAQQQADPPKLQFRVADASNGALLPDVDLKINVNGTTSAAKTDGDGAVSIPLPQTLRAVDITATKPSYVPMRVAWRDAADSPIAVPKDGYTLKLPRGRRIGGTIQDEQGRPVPNAKAFIDVRPASRPSPDEFSRGNPTISLWGVPVMTGPDGKWTFDAAPSQWEQVMLRLDHPDYYSASFGSAIRDVEALKNGTAVWTAQTGVRILGTVKDETGKPVANVEVSYDVDRSSEFPTTRTAADGTFSFPHARPVDEFRDTTLFAFLAPGYAPKLLRIPQAQASAGAIEVTLSPAQPITGQVVNAAGNAVADARVSVHTIGDERLLGLVSARTDAQGRFRIDGGELRMVADVLGGESTTPVRNITLASGVDNLIKLASRVMVRGTVTDALTHQPIAKGRILLSYNSPQRPIWQRQSPRAFSHGRYQMSLSESGPAYLLKFEADGYVPQISRPIARDEGEITYDVKLVPGTGPAGIVRTPDGKPAEGAAIIAADNNTQVVMKDGKFTDQTMTTVLRTGPDGRFGFQPQINDQYTLIATHESGFRMVAASDFAAMGGDLTLQSWATVQGEVRVNGEPAGGSRVDAMAIDPLLRSVPGRVIDIESESTADDQGRFELRVAPMQTMVGRVVRVGEMSYSYAAQARISPTPGATVRLNLGSGGRRVIGKVIVPDALAARGTWTSRFPTLAEKKDPPKAAVPENTDQMTPEQRVAWHNQWLNTDAGRAFKKAVDDYNDRRSYPVVVEADGSFYADDVEPGEYELKVPIANRSSATSIAEPFAAAEAVFIVPPPNAPEAGKPLELSPIPATPIQTVRIGQMAPLFEIATLDGKQFKLEDYRGKFVVIDFWATWCAPCLEEMPAIKLVYDRFGMDDRFVMISLSLDEKVERAQEYVAKEKLGWIHGFVGPWKEMGQSKILDDYAVGGIPSAWLIGPDGRVIAKNVRGEQLTDLLSNHLPPVR